MGVHNLDLIFRPRRIAVVGASRRPGAVGATLMQNLIGSGFDGVVYPVNPKHESVQGVQAYPDVGALPQTPDLAVICTPAATVPNVVRQCGEAGILGVLIISAGFREAGEAGKALEREVRETAAGFAGLRIVGPNCLGIVVPGIGLNATFGKGMPKPGKVAFISQSGALGTAVLDWALDADVGFSGFVSVGNMLDVGFGDLIDYFGNDGRTESIILYIESIGDAREFISAARAFTRTHPIVAYKAGRFAESAAAASSHTGAMAGADVVYEAALERAGIVRVYGMADMFECAELLARHTPPRGDRLAIVTNAGGPAVIATDALIEAHGTLAELDAKTLTELDAFLPAYWSRGNPVDVLGDAPPERVARAVELALADRGVDAALVILAPQAVTNPTATAEAVAGVAKRSNKPILATWTGGRSMTAGMALLDRAGVATYSTPEAAVRAYTALVACNRTREVLHETPREVVLPGDTSAWRGPSLMELRDDDGGLTLTEATTKAVLAGYGITVNETAVAASRDQAVAAADRVGYPVVLKIHSSQITHKTDVGGVALDLHDAESVERAWDEMMRRASAERPDATIDGATVQAMVTSPGSLEMILGARKDPTFGTAIMLGAGGITAELYRDRAVGLPPLNERLARHMLESLRSWPLLQGYRGRPALDVDALIEQVIRFSHLVADHPEISEIDINPLLVQRDGTLALDGRIILDGALVDRKARPYEHLAIRPYPAHYVRQATLRDGTPITLRPIRPEDEPMWHDMLARCSTESLWSRFRAIFKQTTHAMAARYCFIDYDREMAIVAERDDDGTRQLLGVGRLVGDPDRATAEYALLIADDWQGQGLGSLLTDYCLEIARDARVGTVIAETNRENHRMVAIFEARGFDVTYDPERECMVTTLEMDRERGAPSSTRQGGPVRS